MNTPAYIVTGATGGIGSAITDALVARQVPRIILAVRNTEAGLRLAGRYSGVSTRIEVAECDLAVFQSVRNFARYIKENGIPVCALINNAGMLARQKTVTTDGYEATMQVNFLAPALLANLLETDMTAGSSIIFTTSFMRRVGYIEPDWLGLSIHHFNRFIVYSWSKLMLAQYAREIAPELARKGIRVNCTDPGIVDTEILRLGWRPVDWLADRVLRPAISTPAYAAGATVAALDSPLTGQIFTPTSHSPIAMRDHRRIAAAAVSRVI